MSSEVKKHFFFSDCSSGFKITVLDSRLKSVIIFEPMGIQLKRSPIRDLGVFRFMFPLLG